MFKPGRKRLSTTRIRAWIADDTGAAALIIAAVVAVIAFTALSIFLNRFIGGRELQRVQSASSSQGSLVKAVFASFLSSGSGGTYTLPCPDTSATPTGAAGTCTGTSGIVSGVLPWTALGLSKADVVDAYGNYLTYVVGLKGKNLCETVANNMTGTAEVTGSLPAETDLTLDTRGETREVPFAIVGHGPNRLGARSARSNNLTEAALNHELSNSQATLAGGSAATIYNDAYSKSTTGYFDDEVLAPTEAEAGQVCKSLTPGGALNAALTTNFDSAAERGGTMDATKFSNVTNVSVAQATSGGQGNYVARFSVAGARFASNSTNYNFDPRVRKVYVSAEWTPTSATSTMSIVTRSLATTQEGSADTFTQGTTIRFGAASHTLEIQESSAVTAVTGGAFTQTAGVTYIVEAYDDGLNVWGRITRKNSTAVSASVTTTSSNNFADTQQVTFVGTGGANDLDNLTIGLPMLALEFNGNSGTPGYVQSAAGDAQINATTTAFTLEAWIKPTAVPTEPVPATPIGLDEGPVISGEIYRLYLNTSGVLQLTLTGAASAFDTGIKPPLNTWTHVAVTYAGGTPSLQFYQNGGLVGSRGSGVPASLADSGSNRFRIGGDGSGVDGFTGDIADVRLWNTTRTTAEIRNNYAKRLDLSGTNSALVLNWKTDFESGTPGGTANPINTPANTVTPGKGDATAVSGATYVATLAQYFRPFSTAVCSGYEAGAYMCDFRNAGMSVVSANIQSNMLNVYAKVWGGGGGGYNDTTNRSAGGSGGFSQGLIQTLGTGNPLIAGKTLNIDLGPAGAGSVSDQRGGGGGAATGVSVTVSSTTTYGLVAGGGGGASYSAHHTVANADAGVVGALATLLSGLGLLGDALDYYTGYLGVTTYGGGGNGGGGGGYGANAVARAPDDANSCGGRGGNNTPTAAGSPPSNYACANGGDPPTGTVTINGGGGTSANMNLGPLGGVSAAGNGGNGYLSAVSGLVGGGGGGGGATGGEGGGYAGQTTVPAPTSGTLLGYITSPATVSISSGFGGGGGAGSADTAVTGKSGAAGSNTSAGGSTDFYYSPSTYTVANQTRPGRGGEITSGVAAVNGNVILIW